MSNYRIGTLLASKSEATAGTESIPVTVTQPISKIQAVFKATSAGTAPGAHEAANVTGIQLVNGSDVLWNLSGKECIALDYLNTGFAPDNVYTDMTGVMAIATLNINFGRWLWDPVLALDPAKFDNLVLNITHNYRTMDSSASAATLEVYAHIFDKKPVTPTGFLSAKEFKSYTPGASGTIEYTAMNRDRLVRKYMIMAYAAGYQPWNVINHVKISENTDQSVPIDVQTSAWLKHVNQMTPRYVDHCEIVAQSGGRATYIAPTMWNTMLGNSNTVTNILSCGASPIVSPVTVSSTASGNATVDFAGWNPFGGFPIPFGDQKDFNDWYDTTQLGALNLQLTAGTYGSSGTGQIVTEELRKY